MLNEDHATLRVAGAIPHPRRNFIERILVVIALAVVAIVAPPLIGSGANALARARGLEMPDYCVPQDSTSTNACLSKKLPGQGGFFNHAYCKLSHIGSDCTTCVPDIKEACTQPGQGGSENAGYENMEVVF